MKRDYHIVHKGAASFGHLSRKLLLGVAAVAVLSCGFLFCSCEGTELVPDDEDPVEMTLSVTAEFKTKGYVQGGSLMDASYAAVHGAAPVQERNLSLTSWMYTPTGERVYFENMEFARDAGTGRWCASPSVYWPVGVRMDFVAWSSGDRLAEAAHTYDRVRATDALYLKLGPSSTQDDVMFSWVGSRLSGPSGIVEMQFKHSQAWLEVALKMSEDMSPQNVLLHKIVIEDIYTSGELAVTHVFGFAEGKWSFRFDRAEDTVMDDPGNIYGTRLTTEPKYCDMLLPEQGRRDLILYYSLGDQDNVLQFVYHLDNTATWEMGKRYVYEVTFSPSQITVNPSVRDWVAENVIVPAG